MRLSTFSVFLLLFLFSKGFAQDAITEEDYERAVGFLRENLINKKVFNLNIQPHWLPDSSGVWYVNHSPDNKSYLKIRLPELEQTALFDHQKLAVLLSESLKEDIKADNLPISSIEYAMLHQKNNMKTIGKNSLKNSKI